MVRRKDGNGAAVIERKDPTDIAAMVQAVEAESRLAAIMADLEAFRGIVHGIADGQEPDAKMLAAMGDIGRRLHLPKDAVTRAVAAVQDERRHAAEVDRVKSRLVEVKAREPELAGEMRETEAKLLSLRRELNEYVGLHNTMPHAMMAVNGVRGENPLVFAALEHVAEKLLAADAGMSTAVFKGMQPQGVRPEGHTSRTQWEG
jgi:hypothetical protein